MQLEQVERVKSLLRSKYVVEVIDEERLERLERIADIAESASIASIADSDRSANFIHACVNEVCMEVIKALVNSYDTKCLVGSEVSVEEILSVALALINSIRARLRELY